MVNILHLYNLNYIISDIFYLHYILITRLSQMYLYCYIYIYIYACLILTIDNWRNVLRPQPVLYTFVHECICIYNTEHHYIDTIYRIHFIKW